MAQDLGKLVVTPYSAVFSAYSSSLMDVGHIYYRRSRTALSADSDFTGVAQAIAEMRVRAEQDMRGEGFAAESLYWTVELIVQGGDPDSEARLTAAVDFFREPQSVARLAEQARQALGEKTGQVPVITSVGLFARAEVPHFKMTARSGTGRKLQDALKSQRDIYQGAGRSLKAPVYDRERLECGHRIDGPALVESVQTTIWVGPGWRLSVDQYQNAVLERMSS